MFTLSDFRSLRPRHRSTQSETLEWLAAAHARAEAQLALAEGRSFEEASFLETMRRRLNRFGCSPEQIATRGYELDDCSHQRWSDMEVYCLAERASGAGMAARTKAFSRIANTALERLFAEADTPPQHLVHVTCTGYQSPSAAQLLAAQKGWGRQTRVTHAYHMGCYAALPALRISAGYSLLGAASNGASSAQPRVDVVHTELCSLHMNPLRHEAEQLVVQSLFSDGCIAYSVHPEASPLRRSPALTVLSMDEWLVPDSAASMAWFCSDFGMEMVLSRDVPDKIAQSLAPFVSNLLAQAGENPSALGGLVFAIHPGGPKIVDQIAATLGLTEQQVAFSRSVLRERGNMSSATLPHIWQEIARSKDVRDGQVLVSLAFGPGLTLSGAVLRKVCV